MKQLVLNSVLRAWRQGEGEDDWMLLLRALGSLLSLQSDVSETCHSLRSVFLLYQGHGWALAVRKVVMGNTNVCVDGPCLREGKGCWAGGERASGDLRW